MDKGSRELQLFGLYESAAASGLNQQHCCKETEGRGLAPAPRASGGRAGPGLPGWGSGERGFQTRMP